MIIAIIALAIIVACLFLKVILAERKVKELDNIVSTWNAKNLEKELGKETVDEINRLVLNHTGDTEEFFEEAIKIIEKSGYKFDDDDEND